MGEHVFPGADASCPMGWVTTQLERAGFEVQRVQNLGNHYSRTLAQWLDEWHAGKESIVKKYGIKSWRRWEVFLAWSVRVARQGSSTVFMITATKRARRNLALALRLISRRSSCFPLHAAVMLCWQHVLQNSSRQLCLVKMKDDGLLLVQR